MGAGAHVPVHAASISARPSGTGICEHAGVTPDSDPVLTPRLRLEVLDQAAVAALAAGGSLSELGHSDPYQAMATAEHMLALRAAQLEKSPGDAPWLVRVIVECATGAVVGYVNFHAPPDSEGMVEIGYQVVPQAQRRGYATEAANAMWAWAAERGAQTLRASIRPDNEPSLALVRRAGFAHVGEEVDEIDGVELVYERRTDVDQPPLT